MAMHASKVQTDSACKAAVVCQPLQLLPQPRGVWLTCLLPEALGSSTLSMSLLLCRTAHGLTQALVRLVVLCILLACAGAVTKLMAMNMEAARSVVWDNAAMDSMIRIRMKV